MAPDKPALTPEMIMDALLTGDAYPPAHTCERGGSVVYIDGEFDLIVVANKLSEMLRTPASEVSEECSK